MSQPHTPPPDGGEEPRSAPGTPSVTPLGRSLSRASVDSCGGGARPRVARRTAGRKTVIRNDSKAQSAPPAAPPSGPPTPPEGRLSGSSHLPPSGGPLPPAAAALSSPPQRRGHSPEADDGRSVAASEGAAPGSPKPGSVQSPTPSGLRSRLGGGIASPAFSKMSKRAGGLLQAAARTADKRLEEIRSRGAGGEPRAGERLLRLTKASPSEPLGMVLDSTSLGVKTVDPGGPAAASGFEPGMKVVAVGGTRVSTFEELRAAVGVCSGLSIEFTIAAERVAMWEAAHFETLEEVIEEGIVKLAIAEFRQFEGELNGLRRAAAEAAMARKELEALRHRVQHLAKVADEKSAECRRLSELVAKSKTAGEVEQLEALLQQREEQHLGDVESFKQAQAALKVSLRELRAQNEALRARLGDSADTAGSPAAGSPPVFATGSAEGMRMAVEAEQLQERAAELTAENDKLRRQADAFRSAVEKMQEDLKEQDRLAKAARRECEDIRAENGMLHEERSRLARQVADLEDAKEEIVSTMMSKVKKVGHDKDGHLREAADMLVKVQEECEEFRRRLAAAEQDCEGLRGRLKAAEEAEKKARQQEAEAGKKLAAADKELGELREAKRELRDAKLEEKAEQLGRLEQQAAAAEADARRLSNLLAERTAALESSEAQREALAESAREAEERLALLSSIEQECAETRERLQMEHEAALDLADEVDALEARVQAAEGEGLEARRRCAALEADLRAAREQVLSAAAEKEELRREHLAELDDRDTEKRVALRRQAAKLRELQQQLLQQAQSEQMARLEDRLRSREERAPPDRQRHGRQPSMAGTVPSPRSDDMQSWPGSGGGAGADSAGPTYTDISDQNSSLLQKLGNLQEKLWASEQCKKALQEELRRKQHELDKKSAVVASLLQPQAGARSSAGGPAEHSSPSQRRRVLDRFKDAGKSAAGGVQQSMQGVIEEMMYENIKLRAANARLQREAAARDDEEEEEYGGEEPDSGRNSPLLPL
eukprot:TRINITY_DN4961_c0_g2_i1.p1 TRINITY_DN4961_c0_g2~~TRINITY_DN4961_c0_g2_i1.p1  ORF type:complete len:1044 (+),score=441.23 TRINITY_DN4961_c0_g2_i1:125-3133(+)